MRTTYAPTGIFIGFLIGFGAYAYTKSVVIGVIVGIVISIACWYGIKALEKLLEKGVDAGMAAAKNAIDKRKENSASQQTIAARASAANTDSRCPSCGNVVSAGQQFCNRCGAALNQSQ